MTDVNGFSKEAVAEKLAKAFSLFDAGLTREDIGELEVHQQTFAKYINAYRVSLLVQKAYDVGNETELAAKINLCNNMMQELLFGLEKKRMEYDAEQEAIALQKKAAGV